MSSDTPMTFGVVREERQESAMSDLTEAALNELNNIAPESVRNVLQSAKSKIAPASSWIEHQMPKILKVYDMVSKGMLSIDPIFLYAFPY